MRVKAHQYFLTQKKKKKDSVKRYKNGTNGYLKLKKNPEKSKLFDTTLVNLLPPSEPYP